MYLSMTAFTTGTPDLCAARQSSSWHPRTPLASMSVHTAHTAGMLTRWRWKCCVT